MKGQEEGTTRVAAVSWGGAGYMEGTGGGAGTAGMGRGRDRCGGRSQDRGGAHCDPARPEGAGPRPTEVPLPQALPRRFRFRPASRLRAGSCGHGRLGVLSLRGPGRASRRLGTRTLPAS